MREASASEAANQKCPPSKAQVKHPIRSVRQGQLKRSSQSSRVCQGQLKRTEQSSCVRQGQLKRTDQSSCVRQGQLKRTDQSSRIRLGKLNRTDQSHRVHEAEKVCRSSNKICLAGSKADTSSHQTEASTRPIGSISQTIFRRTIFLRTFFGRTIHELMFK